MTQVAFGELVGISQQAVSEFVKVSAMGPGVPAGDMLIAYCERLRETAAGRLGAEVNGLDLVQERAALAKEQRIGHEIKNAIARKEYAPIPLLAEVLAAASQAVAERFEQLPGALRKSCPDMSDIARAQVMATIAAARNEWVARTSELVANRIDEMSDEQDHDEEVFE